jgi:hypothetical protein
VDQLAINELDDAAYNMAAVSATIALYRALVRKGVLAREEARQILLDASVPATRGDALPRRRTSTGTKLPLITTWLSPTTST